MKHLFIPYELALLAKEKGFDQNCLAFWSTQPKRTGDPIQLCITDSLHGYSPVAIDAEFLRPYEILAPLYQQIIDWFREKHGIIVQATYYYHDDNDNNKPKFMADYYVELPAGTEDEEDSKGYDYYEALDISITESLKLI